MSAGGGTATREGVYCEGCRPGCAARSPLRAATMTLFRASAPNAMVTVKVAADTNPVRTGHGRLKIRRRRLKIVRAGQLDSVLAYSVGRK